LAEKTSGRVELTDGYFVKNIVAKQVPVGTFISLINEKDEITRVYVTGSGDQV
jgi:hypothetical protein